MYDDLKSYITKYTSSIGSELWQEIRKESKLVTVKKDEHLNQLGSLHKYAYFIIYGSFVTTLLSEDGDRKAVWFNFDNLFKIAVCPDSYFLDEPTKYELKALENSKVIRIHKEKIDSWTLKDQAFNQMFIKDCLSGFTMMNELRAYKLSHTPIQFLNYIKRKYPIYAERLSSKNMAYFLGITPEWYSRLKKKL